MNAFDPTKKTLMIGIGKPGRGDDALGWKFLDEMETVLPNIDYRYCYQLQVEDAELISGYDQIIFVDASRDQLPQGFKWSEVTADAQFQFTTHRLNPASVLWLSEELYNKSPNVFVLAISGWRWELGDTLSTYAANSLREAVNEFRILDVVNPSTHNKI